MLKSFVGLFLLICVPLNFSFAQKVRQPVFSHVEAPHNYYWRGIYLPHLTSGPATGTFSPDGNEVIYSMAGSLWRQKVGDSNAYELTSGKGYDYQPDWSKDGKFVVFSRRQKDAMELYSLEIESGKVNRLTDFGAVTVEPRVSPDGLKLAFVSSFKNGNFNLYVADITEKGLANIRAIVEGHESKIDRYYYGELDHAINPSWSPDGSRLIYVSNPEVAWGTGDIWSVSVENPDDRTRILSEETTWDARPEIAPDGNRVLYSSYRGRQWNQLWLTTIDGAPPLPLTFGEFDRKYARWSWDARKIVYTSNETGNLSLHVMESVGGKVTDIKPLKRHYKHDMESMVLKVEDEEGNPVSARVSILSKSDGRHYGPRDARMMADDYFMPDRQDHETHYFFCDKTCTIEAPLGKLQISTFKGLEHMPDHRTVRLKKGGRVENITLQSVRLPSEFGKFLSADFHHHMNYGGQYRMNFDSMVADAEAEDLDIVYNLIVNKEERVPSINEFTSEGRTVGNVTVFQAQETHTSYWGHLGVLHLQDRILLPDFSSYRHTALASPYPHNGIFSDLAHEQGALVGYVHPFEIGIDNLDNFEKLTHTLPVDVALGKTDYLEVVSFADHFATAGVWYRLLNLGFRLSAGAGTDTMGNLASLRGPIGLNRAYLASDSREPEALKEAIKSGKGFVTNGPLLGLKINGVAPGGSVKLKSGGQSVRVRASMRSMVPVQNVELVLNGKVIKTLAVKNDGHSADFDGEIEIEDGGWLLLRANSKDAHSDVQDLYPYGTTNPVWLESPDGAPFAPEDAKYFMHWIDLVMKDASARQDYNSEWERTETLEYLIRARKVFEQMSLER
ncbi:CehA/McbA family metallohydrolase [Emcibacter sp.]|uniref:CehA/McbA family metallohydrolase n=1 Tax=Emcibacter sp. TaxID=1979954 RepID=UPI002AA6100A|nr:CehA/McbA family metallohydrolase [Emcibacter sp.]